MREQRFYLCEICGNLVGMIHDAGVTPECCGQPMTELTANTVDASHEKHVPVAEAADRQVKVRVGEAPHPMEAAHHIEWIYLMTTAGGHRRALVPGVAAEATFQLEPDEKPIAAYAYCNLHGLWKQAL